jgi:hypothetical protein
MSLVSSPSIIWEMCQLALVFSDFIPGGGRSLYTLGSCGTSSFPQSTPCALDIVQDEVLTGSLSGSYMLCH